VSGAKMENIDRLSRRLDCKVRIENDNDNQVFIKDCWLHNLYEVVIERPKVNIVENIKKASSKDKEVVRVVEKMKKAEVKVLQREEWQIKRDLELKEEKVYVLKNIELKMEIIQLYHAIPVAEHRGRWKTTELVTRNYW